jgi:hypothetical protein
LQKAVSIRIRKETHMAVSTQKPNASTAGGGRWSLWLDPKLIVPFLQAVVVLFVGWWIKDSVTIALTQKQLDLANVKEMRELVQNLLTPNQPLTAYQSAAVALAPFGMYTMGTFIQLEQEGSDNQQLASEAGIRALALKEPKAVAEQLRRIIRNRTGFYTYNTHLFAVRTLGQMDVKEALPELVSYQKYLAGAGSDSLRLATWRQMVSENKEPGELQMKRLIASLEASIDAIRQARSEKP